MSGSTMEGRPVRASIAQYMHVALPNDANTLGNVLGGHIMHLIDLCGGLAAVRHARRPVVTAAGDHLSFVYPVRVGQVLMLKASVNRVFNTSMEVGVRGALLGFFRCSSAEIGLYNSKNYLGMPDPNARQLE